jgi:hypothetical protein
MEGGVTFCITARVRQYFFIPELKTWQAFSTFCQSSHHLVYLLHELNSDVLVCKGYMSAYKLRDIFPIVAELSKVAFNQKGQQ